MIGDIRPFVEEISFLKHGLLQEDPTWSTLGKFAQDAQ
jgi:hypothetical protein